MSFWIGLIVGLVIGTNVGFLALALLVMAKRSDRQSGPCTTMTS